MPRRTFDREDREELARVEKLRRLVAEVRKPEFWDRLSKAQPSRAQEPDSFEQAVERRAAALGVTPEKLLSSYAKQLQESNYPTPDCLEPEDVQRLIGGGEPSAQQAPHLQACRSCQKLLEVASSNTQDLLEKVQEAAEGAEPISGDRVRAVGAGAVGAGKEISFQEETRVATSFGVSHTRNVPTVHRARAFGVSAGSWVSVLAGAVLVLVLALAVVLLDRRMWMPSTDASITSVALLPLENALEEPKDEYLVSTMTYELNSSLGTLRQWDVKSLGSSMALAGSGKSIPQIAKELHVDAVAHGSVRRENNRLVISVALFDAATNKELGSETYDGPFRDALTMRDQLTRAFAAHAGLRLTGDEEARLKRDLSVNPEALDSYFQGRYRLNERREVETEVRKAITDFEQAIEVEPAFALAYVGLADCYNLSVLGYSRLFVVEDAFNKAIQNAQYALSLDPTLAGAHAAIALSRMWYERNWPSAEVEFKQALALNPNYAPTRHWYGLYLALMGRSSEAISELSHAAKSDPLSPTFQGALGDAYYLAREYERAISQYQKALAIKGDYERARVNLAIAYIHTGNYKEAISILLGKPKEKPSLALAYAVSGDSVTARKILTQIAQANTPEEYSAFEIAVGYAALGDKNAAFGFLQTAFLRRDPGLMQLKVSPDLDLLRSDARFQHLLRQMNFPE